MLSVTCCCYATRGVRGTHVLSNTANKDLDGCHENGWMGFIEGKNRILRSSDSIDTKMSLSWPLVLMEKSLIKTQALFHGVRLITEAHANDARVRCLASHVSLWRAFGCCGRNSCYFMWLCIIQTSQQQETQHDKNSCLENSRWSFLVLFFSGKTLGFFYSHLPILLGKYYLESEE